MKLQLLSLVVLLSACALIGCGGNGSKSQPQTQNQADFSLAAAPATVSVTPGGAAQTVSVIATPLNGFTGNVAVSIVSLPAGLMATPSSLSVAAGSQGEIKISASASAQPGTANISLTGASGTLSHNVSSGLTVGSPVTTASLSTTAFDFGDNLVNNTVTKTVVMVINTGAAELSMNPTISGDVGYTIATSTSCTQQLDPGATCSVALNYAPTTPSAPSTQNATLNMGF